MIRLPSSLELSNEIVERLGLRLVVSLDILTLTHPFRSLQTRDRRVDSTCCATARDLAAHACCWTTFDQGRGYAFGQLVLSCYRVAESQVKERRAVSLRSAEFFNADHDAASRASIAQVKLYSRTHLIQLQLSLLDICPPSLEPFCMGVGLRCGFPKSQQLIS